MSNYRSKITSKVLTKLENFETCRICKKADRSVVNDAKNCAPFIEKVAQIDIDLAPDLPQFVCNLCVERLLDAVKMRDMCLESEAALHMIEPDGDETEVLYYKTEYDEAIPTITGCEVKDEAVTEGGITDEGIPVDAMEPTEIVYEVDEVAQEPEAIDEIYMEEERLEDENMFLGEETFEIEEVDVSSDDARNILSDVTRSRSPPKLGETAYQRKLRKLREKREENRKLGIKPPKRFRTCCQCTFKAEKSVDVEKHLIENHADIRLDEKPNAPIMCQLCWKVFDTRDEKFQHRQVPRKKQYECDRCCTVFESVENYRQHLRDFHNISREFKCDQCPKIYNNVNSLRGHKETVHKGVRHVCDECGAVYKRADTLREHQNLHRQEKPFACPHCEARFARKTGLSSHLRSHTGARPYACEFCDRTFAFATDKKRHLPVHTGVYPYNCYVCSKGFTRKNILAQHLEIHE